MIVKNSPNSARRTAIAVLLATVLVVGAGACDSNKPQVAEDAAGEALVGPSAPDERRRELPVQLVMGALRKSDALTFGEWARAAYRVRCPSLGDEYIVFEAHDNYPGRVDVNMTFAPGTPGQPEASCQPTPGAVRLAAVRTSDLAVMDPPPRANPDTEAVDWLARFRQGEPLPSRSP